MSSNTDVIIIGAGASGLSAAKELTGLGLSYIVVEGVRTASVGGLIAKKLRLESGLIWDAVICTRVIPIRLLPSPMNWV
jgi:cation diffusion facilitator CzcD-associated flavoprotein CzcO